MDYLPNDILTIEDTIETPQLTTEGLSAERRALDISATTVKPSDLVMDNPDQSSEVAAVKEQYPQYIQDTIDRSYQTQADPTEATRRLAMQAQQIASASQYPDSFIQTSLNIESPDYSQAAVNSMINYQVAAEKLGQKMEKEWEDISYVGIGRDFLEFIVRSIFYTDFKEAFTNVGEGRGNTVSAIMTQDPSVAQPEFDKYIEENSDMILGNFLDRFQLYQDALNKGFDPTEDERTFWGSIGVAGTVAGLPKALGNTVKAAAGFGKGARALRNLRTAQPGVATTVAHTAVTPPVAPAGMAVAGPTVAPSGIDLIEANNAIVKAWKNINTQLFKGEATDAEIAAIGNSAAASFDRRFNGVVANIELPSLGNRELTLTVQRPNGTPYPYWSLARQARNDYIQKGFKAEEVELSPGNWYVKVKQNLDLTYVAPEDQLQETANAITGVFAKYLGSARLGGKAGHIDTLRAHAATRGYLNEVLPYIKVVDSVSNEEHLALSKIYDELRDGADAHVKLGYTQSEFQNKWYQTTGNPTPSNEVWLAFNALRDVEDAIYWASSQKRLRGFIRTGHDAITVDGQRLVGKQTAINDVTESFVYNGKRNRLVQVGSPEFNALVKREAQIWKVSEPIDHNGKKYSYVINPNDVDTLKYHDVLPYNAGGRREYTEAGYFVTNGDGLGKAFMAARTEKEAIATKAALEAIRAEYIKIGAPNINTLTNQLDNVIQANPAWNTSISNTQEFVDFLKTYDLDLTKSFEFKAKDSSIQAHASPWDGSTFREYYMHSNKRRDTPLIAYGGGKPAMSNGIHSIFTSAQDAAYQYAFMDASQRMKSGWLKMYYGDQFTVNIGGPDHMFREAGQKLKALPGRTPTQEAMLNEWHVINRRLGVKDETTIKFHNLGTKLREYVLEKTGVNLNIGNPEDKLTHLGFVSQFGFLNTSQFLVQASMTPALAAIAGKTGLQAAIGVVPLRFALHAGGPNAARRLAKTLKITDREATEIMEYFYNTRVGDVLQDSIDKNTAAGFGVSLAGINGSPSKLRSMLHKTQRVASKASKIGLIPYTEGERMITYGSHLTAALEYLKAHPGGSLKTKDAVDFMLRRGSDLTFNMNTSSRAAFQQGIWKVPSQWLAFSLRSAEIMFTDKVFTKAERARLGVYFLATSGVSAFGSSLLADWIMEKTGVEPSTALYTGIKYGAYDGILSYAFSEMTGEQIRTAIGARIAPFDGITSTLANLRDDPLPETAFGPSGSIVFGGTTAVLSAIGNLLNGYPYAARTDLERAARSLGGVNNLMVVRGILMNDAVYTREGVNLGVKTNPYQGLLKLLGFPAQAEKELYALSQQTYASAKEVKDFTKRVEKEFDKALEVYDTDQEEFKNRINEIAAMIELVNISKYDKEKIRQGLFKRSPGLAYLLYAQVVRDNEYNAQRIEFNMEKK